MKPASLHLVVEWILESWKWLKKNLTIKSFKNCGLNLKMDGIEDYLIHCFNEDHPCANGLDMLKEQQNLLSNAEYLSSNLFEISESDTEEVNTNDNLIDPSDSEHDLIDIELQFKSIEKRKLPIVKTLFLFNKRPSPINASPKIRALICKNALYT